MRLNMCNHLNQCGILCRCASVCLCLPERNGLNHLQSEGSLIDWIKPPDRTQTEWKLNKITVIYSSGNGNLSGDSGDADLCPATQIWTFRTLPLSTGKLLMHYSCNGSIKLSTSSSPISPIAACQDSDSSGCTLWFCNAQACLSTSTSS